MNDYILHIDTNGDYRENIAEAIGELGYEIVGVDSGLAAARIALEKPPTIIIMDYDLGDATAVQFIQALREAQGCKQVQYILLHGALNEFCRSVLTELKVATMIDKLAPLPFLENAIKEQWAAKQTRDEDEDCPKVVSILSAVNSKMH